MSRAWGAASCCSGEGTMVRSSFLSCGLLLPLASGRHHPLLLGGFLGKVHVASKASGIPLIYHLGLLVLMPEYRLTGNGTLVCACTGKWTGKATTAHAGSWMRGSCFRIPFVGSHGVGSARFTAVLLETTEIFVPVVSPFLDGVISVLKLKRLKRGRGW